MPNQTRRAFIAGILSTVGAVAIGPVPKALNQPVLLGYDEWVAAIAQVLADWQVDVFIYGTGAIQYCDEWPFVRTVHPSQLIFEPSAVEDDKQFKGLLND